MKATKELTRLELLKKRQSLSMWRRLGAEISFFEALQEQLVPFQSVLSYASFKSELNTWSLNEVLALQGKLILPKIAGHKLKLYRIINLDTQIAESKRGIYEPISELCEEFNPEEVECALIPGIGFDNQFNRLGYGKGFYDRLLPQLSQETPLYGIAFVEQKMEEPMLPESHDIAMTKVYYF